MFVRKRLKERPRVRHRRETDDNIKMDLKEVMYDLDRITLAEDGILWQGLANTTIKFRFQ
jgi:hypothetical protein